MKSSDRLFLSTFYWTYGDNGRCMYYDEESRKFSAFGFYLNTFCHIPTPYLARACSLREVEFLLFQDHIPLREGVLQSQWRFHVDFLLFRINAATSLAELQGIFRREVSPLLSWKSRLFFFLRHIYDFSPILEIYRKQCLRIIFSHYFQTDLRFGTL